VRISVKAHPKAKRPKVLKVSESAYEVWVNEAPDKGRANEAIVEAMSEELKIPKSRLAIASGSTSKNKVLEIK